MSSSRVSKLKPFNAPTFRTLPTKKREKVDQRETANERERGREREKKRKEENMCLTVVSDPKSPSGQAGT